MSVRSRTDHCCAPSELIPISTLRWLILLTSMPRQMLAQGATTLHHFHAINSDGPHAS